MGRYKSKAQEAWANSPEGVEALGQEEVDQRNRASKGHYLPERVSKHPGHLAYHGTGGHVHRLVKGR